MRRRDYLSGLAAAGALSLVGVPGAVAATAPSGGIDATWTTGEQYGIGTVADHGSDDPSRVWFALTEGALTGVRFPRVDYLNVRTLDFLVADADAGYTARTYNVSRTDDAESTVERSTEPAADDALLFRQTTTDTGANRNWTLTVEYATHADHDAVLADVRFEACDGNEYDVYAVLDPSLSVSGLSDEASVHEATSGRGSGRRNGGGRDRGGSRGHGHRHGRDHGRGRQSGYVLTAHDTTANDDEAVFLDPDGDPYNVAAALVADRGFDWATVDVDGGDALSPLLTAGDSSATYDAASGNVALVGRLASTARRASDTVALGFAENADESAATREAMGALRRGYRYARAKYRKSWREYLERLDVPDSVHTRDLRAQYNAAAMALKTAESKQFPGAGLAALAVPWGRAVNADHPSDYGYNFVWSRDLYHASTALAAMGDVEAMQAAVEYVYGYQQDDSGFVPQNTYIDGRTRWGGEQMDNISFPQILAYQLKARHGIGFDDADYDYENVKRSADYVATHGPATGQERWEEEGGYSPSTTAAEIAGLACAASLAADEGERADALVYLALADYWQANTATWMATDDGTKKHRNTPYYFRIDDDRDPDDGAPRSINNGGPTLDERNVIDAGFLELVRLGVTPWDDGVIRNSVDVVDDTIRVETPNGPSFHRYNDDGYGEQGDDPTDSLPEGAPWGKDGDTSGQGRLWPLLTGERGEYELLAGNADPAALLDAMAGFANSGRMIPEQVWDRPNPTRFGWEFGEGTGSATPLSWSMAQFVRLAWGISAGEPVETPTVVRDRYTGADGVSEGPSLSVTFPNDVTSTGVATISGSTDGAVVVVKTPDQTVYRETPDGTFSVDVSVSDGSNYYTVVAATEGDDVSTVGTTVEQSTVTGIDVGDAVATLSDPVGDDHGPGSYVYPTSGEFVDGAFDIVGFDVYETSDRYQFLYRVDGPLTNPWGGSIGFSIQHLQVYLRDPSASDGSTAARTGVNATFESPYQRRLVVVPFGPTRIESADGSVVTDDVQVTTYDAISAIKLDVPKSAVGDVRSLELAPLMLAQNGYSPGSVRQVKANVGSYVFGGGRDDDADPNVIDLVTPDGVTNADALAYSASKEAVIPFISL